MKGVVSRMVWFTLIIAAVAYATYSIAGSIVNAQARGVGTPILIRDELQANVHHLSGMVMVPTACDELIVKTKVLSPTLYALVFETWREPSVTCSADETPRAFRTTLFAPATGVYFVATLDAVALPIAVVPVLKGVAH